MHPRSCACALSSVLFSPTADLVSMIADKQSSQTLREPVKVSEMHRVTPGVHYTTTHTQHAELPFADAPHFPPWFCLPMDTHHARQAVRRYLPTHEHPEIRECGACLTRPCLALQDTPRETFVYTRERNTCEQESRTLSCTRRNVGVLLGYRLGSCHTIRTQEPQ